MANVQMIIFDYIQRLFIRTDALDFDGDGRKELAVESAVGAHTHELRIYKIQDYDPPQLIPGGLIGADGAYVTWMDLDGDGRMEIYASLFEHYYAERTVDGRVISSIPGEGLLCNVYRFDGERYQLSESCRRVSLPNEA